LGGHAGRQAGYSTTTTTTHLNEEDLKDGQPCWAAASACSCCCCCEHHQAWPSGPHDDVRQDEAPTGEARPARWQGCIWVLLLLLPLLCPALLCVCVMVTLLSRRRSCAAARHQLGIRAVNTLLPLPLQAVMGW